MTKKTFIKAVFLMILIAIPLGTGAEELKGDANGDGTLSIKDVTVLINYLLTDDSTGVNLENADTNEDGVINIHDLTGLIEILLTMPDEPQPVEHEYVDLGLPSGTLWATCNVGANAPEEYGDYFAWGETETKEVYTWTTYKWCNGSGFSLTKYCTDSVYGTVDNMTELELGDDVAYINWGQSWRMPTVVQVQELIDNCSWQRTTRNGVNGYLVTSYNGNSLFFPASGFRYGSTFDNVGSDGNYWLRTLGYDLFAHDLFFDFGDNCGCYSAYRCHGRTVRPVRAPEEPQHEYVDLGLPSGTLWATCNVGANASEEYGDYFAWGETEPKEVYDWTTYKWCNGSRYTLTKYNPDSQYGTVDNKTELDLEDDAAYVNWGPSWRMPTDEQLIELRDKCIWTWTTRNGVDGDIVTGPNGNTIFMPAGSCRDGDTTFWVPGNGFYWSSSRGSYYACCASLLYNNSYHADFNGSYERNLGCTIRPVRVSQD